MWLLDTNIASELVKRVPDRMVQQRYDTTPDLELAVSVVTVFELRFGAARSQYPGKLWGRIQERILTRCQVVPLRREEALNAADHLSVLMTQGYNITIQDVLIAGTASALGLILVTRNVCHFSRVAGLRHENWFEPLPNQPAQL